jgi:hypothetical protein
MGRLLKELSPVSSYAAKKTDLWADIVDRINGAILLTDLDELLLWLDFHELDVPGPWLNPIYEMIDARRAELRAEDVGEILRERFDFKDF